MPFLQVYNLPVLPDVGVVAGDDLARGDGVAGDEIPGEVDRELARHVDGGRLAHAVRDVARAAQHAVLGAAGGTESWSFLCND